MAVHERNYVEQSGVTGRDDGAYHGQMEESCMLLGVHVYLAHDTNGTGRAGSNRAEIEKNWLLKSFS